MKRAAIDHPKMMDLCDKLGVPLYQAVGILEGIWHFTAKFVPQGNIGKYSPASIARFLQWDRDPGELVRMLCACRWLDVRTDGAILVHDWPEHADDAVHLALARAGKLFADGSRPRLSRLSKEERCRIEKAYLAQASGGSNVGTVDVSAHSKRTASAPEAHGMRTECAPPSTPLPSTLLPSTPVEDLPNAEPVGPSTLELFAEWYAKYPHKVGRRKAEQAFATALKRGGTPELLAAGLARYIRAKPSDRAWCHPATWLNQDRWLDEPAQGEGANGAGRFGNFHQPRTAAEVSMANMRAVLAEGTHDD